MFESDAKTSMGVQSPVPTLPLQVQPAQSASVPQPSPPAFSKFQGRRGAPVLEFSLRPPHFSPSILGEPKLPTEKVGSETAPRRAPGVHPGTRAVPAPGWLPSPRSESIGDMEVERGLEEVPMSYLLLEPSKQIML